MLRTTLPVCLVATLVTLAACGGTPAPAEKTAAAPAAQPAAAKVNPERTSSTC